MSVIVPMYNAARWIGDCLSSIKRQTYRASQILVVDDGSTDEGPEIVRSLDQSIQLIQGNHQGVAAARNLALQAASGDYVAFLDADDRWEDSKLEKQVTYALAHPEIDFTYTDAIEFNDQGIVHNSYVELFPLLRNPRSLFEAMVRFQVPLTSTCLVRRAFLQEHRLNFYDLAQVGEDIGLFLEIEANGGRFGYIDEKLTWRRLHGTNTSGNQFRRFEQRIVLYGYLLKKLHNASDSQRRVLRWGLRDAHYRVGEWHWAADDMRRARRHLRQAFGVDQRSWKILAYGIASFLPSNLRRLVRSMKHAILDSPPPRIPVVEHTRR